MIPVKIEFKNILRRNELIHAQNELLWRKTNLTKISLISEVDAYKKAMKAFNPKPDDIFLYRRKTIGISTQTFEIKNKFFELVDVGSQKGERLKWPHGLY
jgi:hypothetical protein